MAFDRDGGTSRALEDAFALVSAPADDLAGHAPDGPVETRWGTGFRTYEECLAHIRATGLQAPEGGLALPLPYTVDEAITYSVVAFARGLA